MSTTPNPRQHIAVIGAGISGLAAAWLLSRKHRVTLYERAGHWGGHSNTVSVMLKDRPLAVDTGFIVYNDRNYPNLVALFDHLGVATQASDMSFAASLEGGKLEYSGSDLAGLLAQPANLLKPRFWRMLRDIRRFYARAEGYLPTLGPDRSIEDLLTREHYSQAFRTDHLWPMAGAIWSAGTGDIKAYPAQAMIRFFANHGLLQLTDRPQWRTVIGGAREYVRRLLADLPEGATRQGEALRLTRGPKGVHVSDSLGEELRFDEVVLATHADEALALLADASEEERAVLGAFGYSRNTVWLHEDQTLMPRRRRAWASWNFLEIESTNPANHLCVTYWMNRLQRLDTERQLFVTLNPPHPPASPVHYRTTYQHPLFNTAALRAQDALWSLQGSRRTWFCGAYFGYGFHEDGLQAGLAVAEQLGGIRRPWSLPAQRSRIPLPASSDLDLEAGLA